MKIQMKAEASMLLLMVAFVTAGCHKDPVVDDVGNQGGGTSNKMPSVLTADITDISYNSACCGGTISNQGSSTVISYGVCWSLNPDPKLSDSVVFAESLSGNTFSCLISGLEDDTEYYVRAFAKNSEGVGYGKEKAFITSSFGGSDIPVGVVYSIDEIIELLPGTVFQEPASVYGIITADEVSGNLYKTSYLQDPVTGKALQLCFNNTSDVRIGDSVRVCLEGAMCLYYHGMHQLLYIDPITNIEVLATNCFIEPMLTTIPEINAGVIPPGRLIRLENVMFLEHTTFADIGYASYGNRLLAEVDNHNNTVVVRTSDYADFASDTVPNRACNLIAIASVYNSTWQMILRSKDDIEEFGDPFPTPGVIGEVQSMPYLQCFEREFGTYMTFDVIGSQEWEIAYGTAKMSGYEMGDHLNEDWLISSPVAITGVSDAKMIMVYIGRYFTNINADISIMASFDYEFGNDPRTASWSQVPATLNMSNNWTDFTTTEIALTDYVGRTVTFAVRYLSNEIKAGTIEIQSILIQ